MVGRWADAQLAVGSASGRHWLLMAQLAALAGLMMMAAGCGSMTGCGARVTVDGECETGGAGGEGGDGGAGGEGGTTTSSSASTAPTCPNGCDDGNPCSVDVCEAGACVHRGASSPDACSTVKQNSGVCAWTSCILTDCSQNANTDGEKCFREGGVGVCAGGSCAPPCASVADCDDGNPCTLDYCTPSGACSNPEDTLHPTCGDEGYCWKGSCCEGCFDLVTGECVETCPDGKTCGALGACL